MFTEEPCKEYFVNVTLVERVINAILMLGNLPGQSFQTFIH